MLTKQVIEVLALFIGAWWAYTKFIRIEAPAEQRNFAVDQQLKWVNSPEPSACYAILSLTFQNVSKSEVHIEKAVQRAWLLPLPAFDKPVSHVDPDRFLHVPAIDSVSYTEGTFVQDYPPLAKVSDDLVWTLRRGSGIALFRVDLFADSTDTEPAEWAYDWDEVCDTADPMDRQSPKTAPLPIRRP